MASLEQIFILAFKHTKLNADEVTLVRQFYDKYGQAFLYASAASMKVLPFLANLLISIDVDKDYWDKVLSKYRERNNEILLETEQIFAQFSDFSIEKVFLTENFAALLASGNDIALFCSGDIDIFADISEKEKVYLSFKKLGYVYEERYSNNLLINTCFRLGKIDDFYISVAWEPLSRTKLPSFVSIDDFLNWADLNYYKNSYIKIPDKNSLFYIVSLHMSLHSFTRAPHMRLFADISNVFYLNPDLDWIYNISIKNNTLNRVNLCLELSHKMIDTPNFFSNLLSKKSKKVLRLLVDYRTNELIIEPGKFRVFLLEILFSDFGFISSLFSILFPQWSWVKFKYGSGKSNSKIGCYIKHMKGLFYS